jgi:hypothetical protein
MYVEAGGTYGGTTSGKSGSPRNILSTALPSMVSRARGSYCNPSVDIERLTCRRTGGIVRETSLSAKNILMTASAQVRQSRSHQVSRRYPLHYTFQQICEPQLKCSKIDFILLISLAIRFFFPLFAQNKTMCLIAYLKHHNTIRFYSHKRHFSSVTRSFVSRRTLQKCESNLLHHT